MPCCQQLDKRRYFYDAYAVSLKESKVRPKKYTQDEKSDLHLHLHLVPKCKCRECNTFALVRIHVQV